MADSPFALYEADPVIDRPRPAPGPPTSFLENFEAGQTLMASDVNNANEMRLKRGYDPILEALNQLRAAEGKPRLNNPGNWLRQSHERFSSEDFGFSIWNAPGKGVSAAEQQKIIFNEIARFRAINPSYFKNVPASPEEYLESLIAKDRAARATARDVQFRGEGIGATAGSLTGGLTAAFEDPINILTLPIGGGGKTVLSIAAREAGINALIELAQQPIVAQNREVLGEELTAGEAAQNVAFAGAGGFGFSLLLQGVGKIAGKGLSELDARFVPLEKRLADALTAADVENPTQLERAILTEILGELPDDDLAALVRLSGADVIPNAAAAVTVIDRQGEIDVTNPYVGAAGADTHGDQLLDALHRTLNDLPPADYDAAARAALPDTGGPDLASAPDAPRAADSATTDLSVEAITDIKQRIRGPETGGNDRAVNLKGSSASGRYQFIKGTFKSYYRKVFGGSDAAADRAWQSKRFDVETQEALMDRLIQDNAVVLQRIGRSANPGNLYVMHVLGTGDGPKILRAAADTPVSQILSAQIIAQNPTYFGGGKSASEAIAAIHGQVDKRPASVAASGIVDIGDSEVAILRQEAAQLQRDAYEIAGLGTIESASFKPGEIDVDAKLMQFKGGGDQFGVNDRLQGVEQWNPVLAGRSIVWEAADGRRLIADGHQRLGLAKRISAADPAQNVRVDALVLREADGWDAESARVWAALKNVAEGSGSVTAAAKIMRGMGIDEAAKYLPPRSALVRDTEGVARLGDDAFGMVVNELVDPSHASIVGRIASDPGEQKALLDLIYQLQPQTIGQADSVVRQGIAAGFTKETQEDMFGSLDSTASLFIERAKVLERATGEMRKLKAVHSTAAQNADILEKSGSTIDRQASKQESVDNAQAAEIVQKLAYRAGPVKDQLDDAAQQLAAGGQINSVAGAFVADVRKLDLAALARSGGDAADGNIPAGSGRVSDAGEADIAAPPERGYSDEPDLADGAWPSRDEIESAGQRGFNIFDDKASQPFAVPDGVGAKAQADSLEHDARALLGDDGLDPDIALREAQEAALKAASPAQAKVDQDSTIGSPLFDAADQGGLELRVIANDTGDIPFRIDGDDRTLSDLLDEFDADAAAVEAVRQCL